MTIADDKDFLEPMPVANEGNFLMQKDFLSARLEYVMSLELNAENLERVRCLKRGIVGWRTSFKKQVDEYIREHFNAPKDVYRAAANEVLAEIELLEGKADAVLAEEERKRTEAVDYALTGIIDSLRGGALPDNWVDYIERKKQYYNKTADMALVAEDIRRQFSDLVYKYNEERTSEEAVRKACDDARLDVNTYVGLLKGMPLGQVLEKISQRKEELARLDTIADGVQGIRCDTLKPASNEVVKHMTLELWYSPSKASYLSYIFGELMKNNIKVAWSTEK